MNRLPFIVLLSALLPYLTGQVRAEYIAVPLLLIYSVFKARTFHFDLGWSIFGLVLALAALILGSLNSWETGLSASPFNAFVRLAMPTIMLMSFPGLMVHVDRPLDRVASATTILAVVVAVFAITSIVFPLVGDVLKFWVLADGDKSVWTASLDIGRYNGIFNQPLEAGTFYSVALLAFAHSWKTNEKGRWILLGALGCIMLGGALSLSKNFLVVGVTVALALAIWMRVISLTRALLLAAPVVLVAGYFVLQSNVNYFESLFDLYRSGGVLTALSAGRYGLYESDVSRLFTETWNGDSFWLGHGLGAYLPLDSGYLEFFYQGGIFALAGYVLFLFCIAFLGWRHRSTNEGKTLVAIAVYIALASFGGPVISASRANVSLMLLAAGSVAALRHREKPAQSQSQSWNRLVAG